MVFIWLMLPLGQRRGLGLRASARRVKQTLRLAAVIKAKHGGTCTHHPLTPATPYDYTLLFIHV